MLHKTRGIVFRFTKYGETSIIVTVFTELFGLQAYMVNGVRSKSARSKIALYQPLTFLDLVVYYRDNAKINRIKEIKCLWPFQSITLDIKKSTIAMFINEIINKTVKEESHAQDIFDFLFQAISALDAMRQGYENFHLIFLVKLSRFLGFGAYMVTEVLGARMASPEIEKLLDQLMQADFKDSVILTNHHRRTIVALLLSFYADHIDNLGEIRSIKVLQEIMS